MASFPQVPAREERLLSYVEELRSFALSARLDLTTPEALVRLQERVRSDRSFRSELEALIRSFLYREDCRLTLQDMWKIVALAFTGSGLETAEPGGQAQHRSLQVFLLQAMTPPAFGDPEEGSDAEEQITPSPAPHMQTPEGESPAARPVFPAHTSIPQASSSVSWWAEPDSSEAFLPQRRPPVLSSNARASPGAARPDPWQNDSAFHRELLAFAERRRNLSA